MTPANDHAQFQRYFYDSCVANSDGLAIGQARADSSSGETADADAANRADTREGDCASPNLELSAFRISRLIPSPPPHLMSAGNEVAVCRVGQHAQLGRSE